MKNRSQTEKRDYYVYKESRRNQDKARTVARKQARSFKEGRKHR